MLPSHNSPTQVSKHEFEDATRDLHVTSTETYSNGNCTEHYAFGTSPRILVGWVRKTNGDKTYHLSSEYRK